MFLVRQQFRLRHSLGGFALDSMGVDPDPTPARCHLSRLLHLSSYLSAVASCHSATMAASSCVQPFSQLQWDEQNLAETDVLPASHCATWWRVLLSEVLTISPDPPPPQPQTLRSPEHPSQRLFGTVAERWRSMWGTLVHRSTLMVLTPRNTERACSAFDLGTLARSWTLSPSPRTSICLMPTLSPAASSCLAQAAPTHTFLPSCEEVRVLNSKTTHTVRRDVLLSVVVLFKTFTSSQKPLQSTRAQIGNRMNCKDGKQAQSFFTKAVALSGCTRMVLIPIFPPALSQRGPCCVLVALRAAADGVLHAWTSALATSCHFFTPLLLLRPAYPRQRCGTCHVLQEVQR
jgi:hypothetical protein